MALVEKVTGRSEWRTEAYILGARNTLNLSYDESTTFFGKVGKR